MPYIESVEELAEALADMLGIYNQCMQLVGVPDAEVRHIVDTQLYDHTDDCGCRGCWCARMQRRIRSAAAYDVQHSAAPRRQGPERERKSRHG